MEWPDYHRLLRDCYGHCQGLGLGKKDIHLLLREGELLEQALALSPGAEAAHYARAVRLFRQAGGRDRAYHLIFRLARLLDSRPVGPREEPLLLEVLRAALREEYPDGELFVAVARHVLDRALPIARRGKLTLTALSRRLKPRTLFPGLPRGVRELLGLEEILQVGRQMRVCLSSPRAAEGLWAKILSDQGRLLLLEPRRGHGAHLALLGRGEGEAGFSWSSGVRGTVNPAPGRGGCCSGVCLSWSWRRGVAQPPVFR
ncbi:MAG: hypothetical protein RML14_06965 [Meiothermus sp.]|uniref:hypothetical protein n=1 Tax=Meiothermus sp. TaxID=1955249 RepID=UPI00298F1D1D|nr:hypothetical protein [Meiothermus sp.]MDW8481607.1 hypothetical protein [Meiothermus sp.]